MVQLLLRMLLVRILLLLMLRYRYEDGRRPNVPNITPKLSPTWLGVPQAVSKIA